MDNYPEKCGALKGFLIGQLICLEADQAYPHISPQVTHETLIRDIKKVLKEVEKL